MPARITTEKVIAVAELAELELAPVEADMLARQIDEILAYVDQLRSVDTSGIPPTTGASTAANDRGDDLRSSFDADTALANAPDRAREAGLFRVPRVIGS